MSARRLRLGKGFVSTRYRLPRAWRSRRTASSGRVSRARMACMFRRLPGDEAHDSDPSMAYPPSMTTPAAEPGQLAESLRAYAPGDEPIATELRTSERVLARVTDGIYRQPGSALRELISNAYDADALKVVINT